VHGHRIEPSRDAKIVAVNQEHDGPSDEDHNNLKWAPMTSTPESFLVSIDVSTHDT
jgi:hypothetical protein